MGPSPGLASHEQRWMTQAVQWRKSTTADEAGGASVAWAEIGCINAVIGIPSPSERTVADQDGVDFTNTVKVPASADVRRGDRLVLDGRTIDIVSDAMGTQSAVKHLRGREEPWDEPQE